MKRHNHLNKHMEKEQTNQALFEEREVLQLEIKLGLLQAAATLRARELWTDEECVRIARRLWEIINNGENL